MESIQEYLKKRYEKCIALLSQVSGIMIIMGDAESGKSYLLREMYNVSYSEIKIFHGGVIPKNRYEMLENILFSINKNKNLKVKEIYLDEFDDCDSLDFITTNFIKNGIKVVITTKYTDSYFEKYRNMISEFHIESSELMKIMLANIQYDKEIEADLLKFQTGDWLYVSSMNINKIDRKVLSDVIKVKSEKLDKKDTFLHSMSITETANQRVITIYDYMLTTA